MDKIEKFIIGFLIAYFLIIAILIIQLFIGMIQDHKCYTGEYTGKVCEMYE